MKLLGPIALFEMLARLVWEKQRSERPRLSPTRAAIGGALLLMLVLGIGGFAGMATGIVPIKASAGHWAVTEWVLQFAKRRSVATHTLGSDLPALDDPTLVLKGAGHYETGCRPCHGSPELPHPRVARAMLPRPPYLAERVARWEPDELFYMVKHGIKFTGMPAWPAEGRDDEVRAVVAFLLKLPELDVTRYQHLVFGKAPVRRAAAPLRQLDGAEDVPPAVIASCARCHGIDGTGRGVGAFPKLAGQRPAYLANALAAYAHDERHSGLMQPIAAGLDEAEVRAVVAYYAGLPGGVPDRRQEADVAAVRRGAEIAARGIPGRKVPSCADCHGPGAAPRNPAYPILAGQYAEYLVLQLQLFKDHRRGGSRFAHIMRQVADRLGPDEMRAAALYYASLPAEASVPEP